MIKPRRKPEEQLKPKTPAAKRDGFAAGLCKALTGGPRKRAVHMLSGDVLSQVKEYIPTGFIGMDEILGGGWAVGRASEVFGCEGSGKSALCHMAIRACQAVGGSALYIDFESALDPDKLHNLGIDPEMCLYSHPRHIEQAWDIVWDTVAYLRAHPPGAPFLIVWDSIAAGVPRAELDDKTVEKEHIGLVAKAMSRGCRRMFGEIPHVRAHMLWVNQERDDIGGGRFKTVKTVGGRAVIYACTQRVRCARVMTLKAKGNTGPAVGRLIRAVTKKNRLAPPEQACSWVIDYRRGPSPDLTLWWTLKDARRIKKTPGKATYRLPTGDDVRKNEWFAYLRDPQHRAAIERSYLEVIRAGGPLAVIGEDDE